ncbi:MAG: dihydroorotate dehydrogenase electron transfer subunit [Candidatus Marinimicrobia bacterium]|nr:dihydroorotate dehydrogenase electron transfer subunit [Candidatus Neomarinimicrobiota bacterium]
MKIEVASISGNKEIARGIWKMDFDCPNIANNVSGPGQFINIKVDPSWEIPLRRPMSIAGVKGEKITIIYKLFGKGTKILSELRPGQSINILGPLGNMFTTSDKDSFPILVGGGVGIAPILWLHNELNIKSVSHILIIGATTAEEHFLQHNPDKNIFLTTDDGSMGELGTVVPTMESKLKEVTSRSFGIIYACGPTPMLKAIHRITTGYKIDCQMALESYMGCGIGICQSCVIERKNDSPKEHSYGKRFSLVCRDGPVYSADKVILSSRYFKVSGKKT